MRGHATIAEESHLVSTKLFNDNHRSRYLKEKLEDYRDPETPPDQMFSRMMAMAVMMMIMMIDDYQQPVSFRNRTNFKIYKHLQTVCMIYRYLFIAIILFITTSQKYE